MPFSPWWLQIILVLQTHMLWLVFDVFVFLGFDLYQKDNIVIIVTVVVY
ncbi:hypothetical protein ASAP_2317 [Asaia bogorensis]|uniref:Uncharacterized protein n=1 Tax=Asaia bogorensis TaxID=91915 RepID=A0A060QLH8_9PROT|nr:hypothetical protein ASAP_2317 [Asaia bogorensis]